MIIIRYYYIFFSFVLIIKLDAKILFLINDEKK